MKQEINFLLYSMPDTEGSVQVVVKDETAWRSQKAMAQLFGVGVPTISKHLKNIFDEGELTREVLFLTRYRPEAWTSATSMQSSPWATESAP